MPTTETDEILHQLSLDILKTLSQHFQKNICFALLVPNIETEDRQTCAIYSNMRTIELVETLKGEADSIEKILNYDKSIH